MLRKSSGRQRSPNYSKRVRAGQPPPDYSGRVRRRQRLPAYSGLVRRGSALPSTPEEFGRGSAFDYFGRVGGRQRSPRDRRRRRRKLRGDARGQAEAPAAPDLVSCSDHDKIIMFHILQHVTNPDPQNFQLYLDRYQLSEIANMFVHGLQSNSSYVARSLLLYKNWIQYIKHKIKCSAR